MKYLSVILIILISVSIYSYEVENYSDMFVDEERNNREIEVEIFYPVNEGESTPFPVIIFGHGWLMNFNSYDSFTAEMVENGVILVYPRTEEGIIPDHEEFAMDISFLKNVIQLENENQQSNLYEIVLNETFATGHSMGGGASILATNMNESFSGLFNFAAAETNPSAIAAAANVVCPSIIFSADEDNIAPANDNQLPMYENLESTNKFYVNLLNEGHMNITENVNISEIILPFINYIVSDDELYFQMLTTKLDSLQTSNYIEYETVNSVDSESSNVVFSVVCLNNYPNPFNPTTTINFFLQQDSHIDLSIFNVKGQKIRTLVKSQIPKGMQSILWNGKDENGNFVGTGIYFYKLNVNGKLIETNKCLLIK